MCIPCLELLSLQSLHTRLHMILQGWASAATPVFTLDCTCNSANLLLVNITLGTLFKGLISLESVLWDSTSRRQETTEGHSSILALWHLNSQLLLVLTHIDFLLCGKDIFLPLDPAVRGSNSGPVADWPTPLHVRTFELFLQPLLVTDILQISDIFDM